MKKVKKFYTVRTRYPKKYFHHYTHEPCFVDLQKDAYHFSIKYLAYGLARRLMYDSPFWWLFIKVEKVF